MLLVILSLMTNSCLEEKQESKIHNENFIIDQGNNIYYFRYAFGKDFSKALSAFLSQHPELKVVATTNDGTGFRGINCGYIVVFRNKQEKQKQWFHCIS